MKKRNQKNIFVALWLLVSFVIWTVAISFLDIQAIGPNGSSVGFATLNELVHKPTGVHYI